jgi:uncharacterized cupin superfamily protein
MDRPKNIVNIHDLELQPRPPQFAATGPAAERYDARAALVSRTMGAQKLGFNVTAVPPGKRAFPLHNHQTVEELFFILEGEGQLRLGRETYPVRAGDLVSCPPGGRETAHQFVNTGTADLKFLAVSTREQIDVCDYPDTGKFAVLGEMAPEEGKPRMLSFVGREGVGGVGYWDGE